MKPHVTPYKTLCATLITCLSFGAGAEVQSTSNTPDIRTGYIDGKTFFHKEVIYEAIDGKAFFEGDIVLGSVEHMEAMASGMLANSVVITGENYRWEDNTVAWEFSEGFLNDHPLETLSQFRSMLENAIQEYHDNTHITFVERTDSNAEQYPDYLSIVTSDSNCWSYVGKRGGSQSLGIRPGCSTGNIIHELGHALGLWHEQSREDRDDYISIQWDNISEGYEHNFNQHITDGDDVGAYDYGSIMHYPSRAFSKNGEPTIIPLDPNATIGQRSELSEGDILSLNEIYPPVTLKLISPINLSTLSDRNVTFKWTPVAGSSGYLFKFGRTPDGSELGTHFAESTETTFTKTGLPFDGSKIYVSVAFNSEHGFIIKPYEFTSVFYGMTDPAPGAVLANSSEDFRWTAVEGSNGYLLSFGSKLGGSDLGSYSLPSHITAFTKENLPMNGSQVFVGLTWSTDINGTTAANYEYTSATQAGILQPINGSILDSDTQTFEWEPIEGNNGYLLKFGTTPGGSELGLEFVESTETTFTKSDLPTDGSQIYVQLAWTSSTISGFAIREYNYTAHTTAKTPTLDVNFSTSWFSATTTISWDNAELVDIYRNGSLYAEDEAENPFTITTWWDRTRYSWQVCVPNTIICSDTKQ